MNGDSLSTLLPTDRSEILLHAISGTNLLNSSYDKLSTDLEAKL